MRLLRFVALCAVLWAVPNVASAATQWAVVVGISEYRNLPESQWLKYAHQDARLFADLLKSRMVGVPPDNIQFLLNAQATTVNIRNAIGSWLMDNSGPDDIVYVYLACHGVVDRRNEAYFTTYDTDPERLYASAYPMLELKRILGQLRARHLILVSDTCKSGSIGRDQFTGRDLEAPRINDFFKGIVAENAEIAGSEFILTAAGSLEKSLEAPKWGGGHGVFTHFLVDGLRGKADRDGNGKVTANEIYDFVREQVRRETDNKQNPVIASTKFDGNLVLSGVGILEAPARAAAPPSPTPPPTPTAAPRTRAGGETGTLTVTVDADGVELAVDDRPQGTIRSSEQVILTLPAGSHVVSAQKPGLPRVSQTVAVEPGKDAVLKLKLLPASSPATAASPPGPATEIETRFRAAEQKLPTRPLEAVKAIEGVLAEIFTLRQTRPLDARETTLLSSAMTSLLDDYTRKKQHAKISSLMAGYFNGSRLFPPSLRPERWPEVAAWLKKGAATLTVRVVPVEASVELDAAPYETASGTASAIAAPGSHTVKISAPGYRTIEETVALAAAESRELSFRLPLPAMTLFVLSETPEVRVRRDGGETVATLPYAEVEPRLSPDQQAALRRSMQARGLPPQTHVAVLSGLPAETSELKLRLDKEKHRVEDAAIAFPEKLREEIYASRGAHVWERLVRLEPLTGKIEIASTPAGADVLLNREKIGVTPLAVTQPIGSYEISVKHGVLRHREAVELKTDDRVKLDLKLRPPLVFLGIHSRTVAAEKYRDLEERIRAKLAGAFVHTNAEYQNPSKYEFTRDFLMGAVEESQPDLAALHRHLEAMRDRFESELFLFGYFPSERHYLGNTLRFYVFSTHASKPDFRDVPTSGAGDLDAFFKEIDRPALASADLFRPYIGLRTLDTELTSKKLVVLAAEEGSPAAAAGLKPGDSIVRMNGGPASSAQLLEWVDSHPVGTPLEIEVDRGSGAQKVTIKSEPVPALLINPGSRAVLNTMIFQLELKRRSLGGAPSVDADIVLLNQALAYMQFEDWKAALEILNKFSGEQAGSRILQPAVFYYRGFCFEQLGDNALARRWYDSASREKRSLIRSQLSFDFQTLSSWRLNYLK